jgi:hypothetical protein
MAVFKIHKRQAGKVFCINFENYIRTQYRYFFNNERTKKEVKIIVGREYITIHIKAYYGIICNDLRHLNRNGLLKASTRSLNWLKAYGD